MVKIVTQNVCGMNNYEKRRGMYYFLQKKADIICLQETHSQLATNTEWGIQWKGKSFWSHGTGSARGVALLIKDGTQIEITNTLKDTEGRMIGMQYKERGECFVLINIYAPNIDDPKFFLDIFRLFEEYEGKRIITGDFNLVMNVELDRIKESTSNHTRSLEILQKYMEDTMMCDVWRDRNGNSKIYTFMRPNARKKTLNASRLDMFIIDISLAGWVTEIKIFPKYRSDHCPVVMEIKPFNVARGRGTWKLNNSVLQEMEYLQLINETINNSNNVKNVGDPHSRWECMKIAMISNSQRYCQERAANRNLVISQLEQHVQKMYDKGIDNLSDSENNVLERTQSDLDQMKNEKIQHIIFRSKAKWHNESEASTKYFYNLEKYKSNAKNMNCILLESGQTTTDPQLILRKQYEFYSKLYKSEQVEPFDFKNDTNCKLTKEMVNNTEGLITLEEIRNAVKDMKRGRSPGLDGLTTEFYMVFLSKFDTILMEAINFSFTNNRLYDSALRGLINLIPKGSKDVRILNHLRPIVLLCTDYKIIEKILANRLKPILEYIINEDQKGFMADRRISCNIRRIMDLMTYTDQEDIPGMVLSIDFLKCFDRIEITALIQSMQYFEFGPDFQHWTKILFTDAKACIVNNGHFSKYINIQRGVKQGGPCSAFFFLLIAEVLAIEIRKNKDIKGIMVESVLRTLGQYADDIDIYLFGTEESLNATLRVIENFGKKTGFKINYDKTTIYRIGSLKNSVAKFYTKDKITIVNQINVLGIHVCHDKQAMQKLNYAPLCEKAEGILKSWSKRGLSLIGKTMIINTLIASLFVYRMTVLPLMEAKYIDRLNKMVKLFLWDGKRSKISLEKLQMPKGNGGINVVNFQVKDMALKASWVQILETDSMLQDIAYKMLNVEIRQLIWECNLETKDIRSHFKDTFWRDVLIAWSYMNHKTPESATEIHEQVIWYNSYLKINKKLFFLKKPYDEGLMYIGQLFSPEGELLPMDIIMQMFGISTMQWNSIVNAIPKAWKKAMAATPSGANHKSCYKKFMLTKKCVSYYYKTQQRDKNCLMEVFSRWKKDKEMLIEFDDVTTKFNCIYAYTTHSKYRSFQYRLLHQCIFLNDRLYRWNVVNSENCTFCNNHVEDNYHFWWTCQHTQEVWGWVIENIHKIDGNVEINLNYQNIIFNMIIDPPTHVRNFILLIAKQLLFGHKCKKEKVSKIELSKIVDKIRKYELYYAIANNKLTKHIRKWCCIENGKIIRNNTGLNDNYVEYCNNQIDCITNDNNYV